MSRPNMMKRLLPFTSMLWPTVNTEFKNKQFLTESEEVPKPFQEPKVAQNRQWISDIQLDDEDAYYKKYPSVTNRITKKSKLNKMGIQQLLQRQSKRHIGSFKYHNWNRKRQDMGDRDKCQPKLRITTKRYLLGLMPFELDMMKGLRPNVDDQYQYPDLKMYSDLYPSSFLHRSDPDGYGIRLLNQNGRVPYKFQ